MLRTLLKSKIHRATVTKADLHYEGSITIDAHLMKAADLIPHEHVHIWNLTNGNRFETYVIPGHSGSGEIQINGAAAHHAKKGDQVIISSFAHLSVTQARKHKPRIVFVDPQNRIQKTARKSGHNGRSR